MAHSLPFLGLGPPLLGEGDFVFTTSLSTVGLGKGGAALESWDATLPETLVMGSSQTAAVWLASAIVT